VRVRALIAAVVLKSMLQPQSIYDPRAGSEWGKRLQAHERRQRFKPLSASRKTHRLLARMSQLSIYRADNLYKHHAAVLEVVEPNGHVVTLLVQYDMLNDCTPQSLPELAALKRDSLVSVSPDLVSFLYGSPVTDVHVDRVIELARDSGIEAQEFTFALARFVTVCAAREQLRYNMLLSNCEHLAHFVLTGRWYSSQAEQIITSMAMLRDECDAFIDTNLSLSTIASLLPVRRLAPLVGQRLWQAMPSASALAESFGPFGGMYAYTVSSQLKDRVVQWAHDLADAAGPRMSPLALQLGSWLPSLPLASFLGLANSTLTESLAESMSQSLTQSLI
jgi:hypothetical protein